MKTLRYWWQYRTDILWSLLLVSGFWRMRTEGGYYRDGYWLWRFWTPYRVPSSCFSHATMFVLRWPFLGYLGWVELRLPCEPHPEPWYEVFWRKHIGYSWPHRP